MKITKGKTATIALLLISAVFVSFAAIPISNAQVPRTKNTFCLIGALPNPVQVGKETLLWVGITDFTTRPQMGWKGLSITITRPDGSTETIRDIMTDTTGMTGVVYVPTMVGNYTLQAHFPEQKVEAEFPGRTQPLGTIMKASSSEKYTLIVQQEPTPIHPGFPLPTEYWARPIDAQLREWAPISGNWLTIPDNRLAPYNEDAPETAHILWAKPLTMGGLIGGEFGELSYEHGDAYQGKWASPAIINGILYYNRFPRGFQGGIWSQGIFAVDLRTGEELWFRNNTRLAFAQIVYWDSFNLHGAYAYLWDVPLIPGTWTAGTTWHAYDAFTGEWVYTLTDVPAGTNVYGPKGEILRYVVDLTRGWMALWNSTRAVDLTGWATADVMAETGITPAVTAEFAYGSWIPFKPGGGRIINASKYGIQWNVTIPRGLPGAVKYVIPEDRIIGSNTYGAVGVQQPNPVFWAISTAPGQEGRLIFNVSWTLPIQDLWVDLPPGTVPRKEAIGDARVFVVGAKETRQYWGFDLDTGRQVWGPTEMEPAWNVYSILYGGAWGASSLAYGKLYTAGIAGVVNAYDLKTGKRLWSTEIVDPYAQAKEGGQNWPLPITIITDGKIYLFHQEHSGDDPRPRAAAAVCLNATNGEVIWRIDGAFRTTRWGGQPIIADNIIAMFDTYDNRIYAIGKGPSATSVAASPKVSVHGSKVLVEGTVTDISPGTKDSALQLRFPNGVPAVADECMSDWMLYVYKQFPCPANVKGVEVVIEVLDPNGNYYEVARATTDGSGFYKASFTPPVPGEYTIVARFAGSKAYWGSYAETAIYVEDALPPTPPPTPAPQAPVETYFAVSTIAIIVAIVVAVVLLLRKK
ncbi:MAG: PQQ-binding-like beta-propeller repeat protein [Candidatus Bathyarchaeia archaeon]